MIKGVTKSGFEYEIAESAADNFEVIEEIAKVSEGNVVALVNVLNMVLGHEQKQRLYNHIRTENGNVPMSATERELTEIFTSASEIVNSKN